MTSNEHPGDDRLGGFVSGALSASERAAVVRHLDTCHACAREAADAAAARAALGRLETVAPPAGIADHVFAAAEEPEAERPVVATGSPRWYRWGGAAAVAAGFALVLLLVLPNLGGKSASVRTSTGAAARSPVAVEISGRNFQPSAVGDLAVDTAAGRVYGGLAESSNDATPVPGVASAPAMQAQAKVVGATACVKKAFREVDGTLGRLIQARFEGEPAYLAVYTQASTSGEPSAVTVRVASIDGCRPLTIAHSP